MTKVQEFRRFLRCYLTDAQVALLKEALQTGRKVYFYGAEGTGKTYLCEMLHRCGVTDVDEPGQSPCGNINAFTLPRDVKGVVLIELYRTGKALARGECFDRDVVSAWIKA